LLLLVFGVTWEAMAWVYRKEHKIKLRSLAEAVRYVNS
jgi:hypothetical protein